MNAKTQTPPVGGGSHMQMYQRLTTEAQRRDVPYATRRMILDAADCIADLTCMFRKHLQSQHVNQPQPVQQAQAQHGIDPAHEAWVRSLDGWATSPEGNAELAAMEARWEAEEMTRAAREWDGAIEF